MDPLEFFEKEFNDLQQLINNTDQLNVQSKELYTTIVKFQKVLLQIITKTDDTSKTKKLKLYLEVLEQLVSELKKTIELIEQTEKSLNKIKNA